MADTPQTIASDKPKVADTLRRANVANIVKKLNAGKTLTKVEQDALAAHEASERPPVKRLTKAELCREFGISKVTLDEYLNRTSPKPPQPDEERRYSAEDVGHYIAINGVKAVTTEEMRRMREAMLRIQLEREEIELAKFRGTVVEKSKIAPAIAAFMSRLAADLIDIFEKELPAKCHGRTTVEIAELMAAGVDRVLKRLKAGAAPLMT